MIEGILFLVLVAVSIPVYLIPTIVALKSNHFTSIFLLNFLLGWTFLGWVGALIWAVVDHENRKKAEQSPQVAKMQEGLKNVKPEKDSPNTTFTHARKLLEDDLNKLEADYKAGLIPLSIYEKEIEFIKQRINNCILK